jgi:hypothetical protein
MVNQNPTESQASQVTDAKAGATDPVPPMDPTKPIEVASTGDGTVTDPSAKDNKPPAVGDSDFLFLA